MHTQTNTHILACATMCRLLHPAECDLCLAPVLHPPPMSLLISGMAEEVLQETTPTALCTDLACMSGLFPDAAWPQDAAQSKKKESRTLTRIYSWIWLVSLVTPEKKLSRGV